ncbi:creatininase family protein [Planctomycetota bacterium]
MNNDLSPDVQMQLMRPGQLEEAMRAFPVVYVPFGLIEWHGRHLPLGNDALKAHAILVKTAEQFGGVVYPPVFYPSARHNKEGEFDTLDYEYKIPMVTELFTQLKKTGFRVIIGVSGHNIIQQIQMIERGLDAVTADGTVAGAGLWEVTLSKCDDSATDHAAKWETSNMMFFYPDRVDLSALGEGELAPGMKAPDGIGGLDPREHASAEVGQKNAELASKAIGEKAKELLESLPEDKRAFSLEAISPEHWWLV